MAENHLFSRWPCGAYLCMLMSAFCLIALIAEQAEAVQPGLCSWLKDTGQPLDSSRKLCTECRRGCFYDPQCSIMLFEDYAIAKDELQNFNCSSLDIVANGSTETFLDNSPEGDCILQDSDGVWEDYGIQRCKACQQTCLLSSSCVVMLFNDTAVEVANLPSFRCVDQATDPTTQQLCVLLDANQTVFDASDKTCSQCSFACSTSPICMMLVWDGARFIKSATSNCKPITFWETFYSLQGTQQWLTQAQDNPEQSFAEWRQFFKREYSSEEALAQRQDVWSANIALMALANANGVQLVPTQLADTTLNESVYLYGGVNPQWQPSIGDGEVMAASDDASWGNTTAGGRRRSNMATPAPVLPQSFDWRDYGMPVQVRSQLVCGSCYAFSATTVTENVLWMTSGKQLLLSPQDVMHCCSDVDCWPGNNGGCYDTTTCGPCTYGWPHAVLAWVSTEGQKSEAALPYSPFNGDLPWNFKTPAQLQECQVRGVPNALVTETISFDLASNVFHYIAEDALKALVLQSPVVVGVNIEDDRFRLLGPLHTVAYPSQTLADRGIQHVVVLLGWGLHPTAGPYWLVQNSWDVTWGDGGFGRLARTPQDPWHILDYATGLDIKPVVQCLVPGCLQCVTGQAHSYLKCAQCQAGYTLTVQDAKLTLCTPERKRVRLGP